MTPAQFTQWLADMQAAGLATSDAHCARLLERTPQWVLNAKARGTDNVTALACQALLAGLEPYPAHNGAKAEPTIADAIQILQRLAVSGNYKSYSAVGHRQPAAAVGDLRGTATSSALTSSSSTVLMMGGGYSSEDGAITVRRKPLADEPKSGQD